MTTKIVIRGGGWLSSAGICRSAYCDWDSPSIRYGSLGFRVVKEKKVEYRVYRGGSWYSTADNCRSAARYWRSPSDRSLRQGYGSLLGFRVIKESKDDN
tara:strand:- start:138 stop:434 length:297 start_codon:yes stop_codon:yes gene_type:complete